MELWMMRLENEQRKMRWCDRHRRRWDRDRETVMRLMMERKRELIPDTQWGT